MTTTGSPPNLLRIIAVALAALCMLLAAVVLGLLLMRGEADRHIAPGAPVAAIDVSSGDHDLHAEQGDDQAATLRPGTGQPSDRLVDGTEIVVSSPQRAAWEQALDRRHPMYQEGERAALRTTDGRVFRGDFVTVHDGMVLLVFGEQRKRIPMHQLDATSRLRVDPEYRARRIDQQLEAQ